METMRDLVIIREAARTDYGVTGSKAAFGCH